MTPHGNDPSVTDDPDNGVLTDAPSIEASGIGLPGTQTAHVTLSLPHEEDDEDVVEDDIELDSSPLTIAQPAHLAPSHAVTGPDRGAGQARDTARDRNAEQDGATMARGVASPGVSSEDSGIANPNHSVGGPVVAPGEKESFVGESTEQNDTTPERRDVAPTAHAETSVLVSRRIGELTNVSERETPDLLTADRLLDPSRVTTPEPDGVWQHLLYSVTGGKVNLGDGKRARARKALDRRIASALPGGGARFVAIVSRKGGVGKTTVTTLLGQALADARDDRVIAVDANPDRGTLAERIARHSGRTVRDLVRERANLRGYNDVSAIVARDETRLDVLASDSDPRIAEAFSGDEYRAVADVAAHYYSVVLTDTGTGIVHSVMAATLERADRLIVVAGHSLDEARLASETLTWLETNGYEDRVRSALVVMNMSASGTSPVRQDELEAHFRTRVRDVLRIPYDPQLATGGAIVFRDLQPATRAAARELAAKVVEGLQSVPAAV